MCDSREQVGEGHDALWLREQVGKKLRRIEGAITGETQYLGDTLREIDEKLSDFKQGFDELRIEADQIPTQLEDRAQQERLHRGVIWFGDLNDRFTKWARDTDGVLAEKAKKAMRNAAGEDMLEKYGDKTCWVTKPIQKFRWSDAGAPDGRPQLQLVHPMDPYD